MYMVQKISCLRNSKISPTKTYKASLHTYSIRAFVLIFVLFVFYTSKNCICQLHCYWFEKMIVACKRECSFLSKNPTLFHKKFVENNSGEIYCLTKKEKQRLTIKMIAKL